MADEKQGQVSEVVEMDPDEANEPVSDSQAVGGNPSDEPGEADNTPANKNA